MGGQLRNLAPPDARVRKFRATKVEPEEFAGLASDEGSCGVAIPPLVCPLRRAAAFQRMRDEEAITWNDEEDTHSITVRLKTWLMTNSLVVLITGSGTEKNSIFMQKSQQGCYVDNEKHLT